MNDKLKTVQLEETRRRIDDRTKIVRYMKLETLLLMLNDGLVFIPSHATLGKSDRLEMGILFDLPDRWNFWENLAIKIEPELHKFVYSHSERTTFEVIVPSHDAESVRRHFHTYIDRLAIKRCIWCWNEFRGYSNALWHLYGNRGVAVTSTVGKVKAALVRAGAACGIVAPIAYINHEGTKVSKVLTKEKNIIRPHLLKSIAFNYEKEIRFILAAQWRILEDKGGVLIPIDTANFIDHTKPSPHLQREEQSTVIRLVKELLDTGHKVNRKPSLISDWIAYYGTPFEDGRELDLS